MTATVPGIVTCTGAVGQWDPDTYHNPCTVLHTAFPASRIVRDVTHLSRLLAKVQLSGPFEDSLKTLQPHSSFNKFFVFF